MAGESFLDFQGRLVPAPQRRAGPAAPPRKSAGSDPEKPGRTWSPRKRSSCPTASGSIRVPIRSLEEYRFRYDPNRQPPPGQGDGSTEPGDVLGAAGPPASVAGGSERGDQPGVDYYEAEVTVDELAEMIFADLGLPELQGQKEGPPRPTDDIAFTDVRKHGPVEQHRQAAYPAGGPASATPLGPHRSPPHPPGRLALQDVGEPPPGREQAVVSP